MSCGGINAGDLNKRVELRHISQTKDDYGEEIPTWPTAYATVWASVRQMQGAELQSAQQISAVATYKIRIRHNANIVTTDRIIFGTRVFEISAPPMNFQERNIYDDILCVEVVE